MTHSSFISGQRRRALVGTLLLSFAWASLAAARPFQPATGWRRGPGAQSLSQRPLSSQAGLHELLMRSWVNAGQRAPRAMYDLYSDASVPNVLKTPAHQFVNQIARIAAKRPAGARSNAQDFGGAGDVLASIAKSRSADPRGAAPLSGQIDNTFFRFERTGMNAAARTRDRVYINATADFAPELMSHIVRNLVDNPGQFPGITMAKIAGPKALAGRADNIVIYTDGPEASARVIRVLKNIQELSPHWFQPEVPAMTLKHAAGIAQGAEPLVAGSSFGAIRSAALERALEHTLKTGGHSYDYAVRALHELEKAGVDSDRPHLNLAP
jgi:hypothetical protein